MHKDGLSPLRQNCSLHAVHGPVKIAAACKKYAFGYQQKANDAFSYITYFFLDIIHYRILNYYLYVQREPRNELVTYFLESN